MIKIQRGIVFVLVGICTIVTLNSALGQTPATQTAPRPGYTYFPYNLVCDKTFNGDGPTIGLITIGKTTLQEVVNLYSPYFNVTIEKPDESGETRIYFYQPSDESIYKGIDVCVLNDTIVVSDGEFPSIVEIEQMKQQTAVPQPPKIPISFEYLGIKHFIAKYGIPDIITYTPEPTSRIAFWFKEGIAAEFYVVNDPTQYPPSFGSEIRTLYFPFQDVKGYEDRWPFSQTIEEEIFLTEVAPFVATDVPTKRNPFDFEAIIATLTAEPSHTTTPTFVAVTITPSSTATP